MIKSNTVLILGAGASFDYGFPLGRPLLLEIGSELSSNSINPFQTQLNRCGFSIEQLKEFGKELLNSMQPSVDAFLEKRMENKEFVEIGKLSIAAKLMPLEVPDNLRRGSNNRDMKWYEYLFGLLGARKEEFDKNKLAIITFNYDRSLEYFLLAALSNTYALDVSQAVEFLRSIPIVHIYGQLGELDLIDSTGRPYTPDFDSADLKKCASEISIIHEYSEITPSIVVAHQLMSDADTLCFLGFGYHDLNVQRLEIDQSFNGNRFWGTAYGLKDGEAEKVQSLFNKKIELGYEGERILDFIRRKAVFIG